MSERERWIVYPLLFLALGAALRDKLINSTESQRIKCQGLMVYDSSGQVSMVLGAEQFPDELRQGARNMLLVDQLHVTENATANSLKATTVVSENLSMGKLAYVDRQQGLTYSISGPNVIRLLAWLDQFQRYASQVSSMMQRQQQGRQLPGGQVVPGPVPANPPASGDGAVPGNDRPDASPQEEGAASPNSGEHEAVGSNE